MDHPRDIFEVYLEFDVPDEIFPAVAKQFGGSHDFDWVGVLAETPTPISTTIAISRTNGLPIGQPLFSATVDLSSDTYAAFFFRKRAAYSIEVDSPEHSDTVDVPRGTVDCNRSHDAVLLTEYGTVESFGVGTLIEC